MLDSTASFIARQVVPDYIVDIIKMNTTDAMATIAKRKRKIERSQRRKSHIVPPGLIQDKPTSIKHLIKDGASVTIESRGTGFYAH